MPAREKVEKGAKELRRMERHLENVATKLASRDTMTHFVNAGMDVIQAANAALKQLDVPEETKVKIHKAEREVLLAARDMIDAVLAEVETELPKGDKSELRKVEVKRKSK